MAHPSLNLLRFPLGIPSSSTYHQEFQTQPRHPQKHLLDTLSFCERMAHTRTAAYATRSAVDATRFTATSPHAWCKPTTARSAVSNTISPSSTPSHSLPRKIKPVYPSPSSDVSSETPAQKVARLRAAHEAQKLSQISAWDKVVVRGRVWADVAHKCTAYMLIGATGMFIASLKKFSGD